MYVPLYFLDVLLNAYQHSCHTAHKLWTLYSLNLYLAYRLEAACASSYAFPVLVCLLELIKETNRPLQLIYSLKQRQRKRQKKLFDLKTG